MAKKSLEQVVRENQQLGFDKTIIEIAYANVNGDADRVIEQIFRLQQMSNNVPTKPANANDEDAQLSKAIEMSITEAKDKKISLEPLNPEQRVRKVGIPVGLKNVGNTCYFNSLLQTYFQNVQLVRTVLSYRTPQKYKKDKKATGQDENEFKRKQASCRLVENLRLLFASMIGSDKKYVDPTEVITSVVDDYGNQIPFGDQKDIGEFNLVFLSRIDQGLQLSKKENEMMSQQPQADSPSKIAAVFGDESNISESRLIHRSSVKIEHNSLVNQHFIGLMENSYINQAQNISQAEEQQFSLLFVNVKHKELYKAVEQITIQHIDDYRNEKGEVVGVEKQSWIKKPPKTLFFQIDRVVFEKESGQLRKINDEFDFPQIFYIDPFLLKNKEKALIIQKKVRKLREEREKYTNAVKHLQKFGEKNLNLIDLFTNTILFMQHQKNPMQADDELQNPTIFANLSPRITPQYIDTLRECEKSVRQRLQSYHAKITKIDEEIQHCYSAIKSTPYHLYSILIHEGSADSGHYYSYTYDIKTKTWRKYNDINITEQAAAQVIKQAKGINFTSAYYLVYSQESVLAPTDNFQDLDLRNYELSTSSDRYMKDYYSSMLPGELVDKITLDNNQLYMEIQQFKMGAFANRVVDSYTKKFETCNESFRKAKFQKKKNSPPLLINLPLYLKSQGLDEVYKTSLLVNANMEYGPKEYSPIFEDLVTKKMTNLNEFKRPKTIQFDQKHSLSFMNNVYKSIAATKLFEALKNEQYHGIFALLTELKSGEPNQYFDWLTNLVSKVLMVTFLAEAQKLAQLKQYEKSLERFRFLTVLGLRFINREQEKILLNNCIAWLIETEILLPDELKNQTQNIKKLLTQPNKQSPYDEALLSAGNMNNLINEIKSSTDINDALWNLSRSENVYVDRLLLARGEVKNKMEAMNEIYKEMKKKNYPLNKAQREMIVKKLEK